MEEPTTKYILLFDRVGRIAVQSLLPHDLTTQSTPKIVLRGELLEGVPEAEQPTDLTKVAVVGVRRKSLHLECSTEDMTRLSEEEANLLLAITSLERRYRTFEDKKCLAFGKQLLPGSAVFVKVKGKFLRGVVSYKGEIPSNLGTWFGVKLIEDPGSGTCDGTFKNRRFFTRAQNPGVFVGLDELTPQDGEDDLKSQRLAKEVASTQVNLKASRLENLIRSYWKGNSFNAIEVNERVVALINDSPARATVRYICEEKESTGKAYIILGLELDERLGFGTGERNGDQKFLCETNHAIFVLAETVIPEMEFDKNLKATRQEACEKREEIHQGIRKKFVRRLRRKFSIRTSGKGERIRAAEEPWKTDTLEFIEKEPQTLSEFECKNLPHHQVDDVIMHDEERADSAEGTYFKDGHLKSVSSDGFVQTGERTGSVELIAQLQQMQLDASKVSDKTDLKIDLEKIASDKGFRIVENEGSGNCMFYALSDQLEIAMRIKIKHDDLRQILVQYLRKNPKLPDGTNLLHFVDRHQSWADYLTYMERDGVWGDHIILCAATNCYKTSIRVVSSINAAHDVILRPLCPVDESRTLVLGHIHEVHFVSLHSTQGKEQQSRDMESELPSLQEKPRENNKQEKPGRLIDMDHRVKQFRRQLKEKESEIASLLGEKQEQHDRLLGQLWEMEKRVINTQGQLQEKHDQLVNSEAQVRRMEGKVTNLQRTLLKRNEHLENLEDQVTEARGQLQEKDEEMAALQNQVTTLQRTLMAKNQKVIELETNLSTAQQLVLSDWVISRDQVQVTERCLGRGAWGIVMEGRYCGCAVAVKQLHGLIISPHSRRLFEREMNIASRCRHPCMLQFIGATNDEHNPLFVTELMEKSLRTLIEQKFLSEAELSVLSLDVARALNYLHQKRPSPIIHRDISSANVLLWRQGDRWRAKVSDYGTANFRKMSMTPVPGALIYSAPEALTNEQTVKIDVFSFGVLLCEMSIQEMPDPDRREQQVAFVTNCLIQALIRRCLETQPEARPTMEEIIDELEQPA